MPFDFMDHMASLLESGKYSDATIVCRGQEFKVHKNIICPQSPVIAAALDGNFTEATTDIVNMDSFDIDTVTAMLKFVYGGKDKSLPEFTELEPFSELPSQAIPKDTDEQFEMQRELTMVSRQLHVESLLRINGIGDYYKIAGLCECSRAEIMIHVSRICGPFSAEVFMDAVLSTTTYTGDKELHRMLTKVAIEHIEDLHDYGCHLTVLTSLENFTEQYMAGTVDRLKGLNKRVNDIEKNTADIATITAGIKKCSATMRSRSKCSQCQASYNSYFKTNNYKTYRVCCKKCSPRTPA